MIAQHTLALLRPQVDTRETNQSRAVGAVGVRMAAAGIIVTCRSR
jgi:hypothetical protein